MTAMERARQVADALQGWERHEGSLYMALAAALDNAITVRTVPERLPSERTLAALLSVSRTTVALAYEELRERGLIDRDRGSGTVALQPSAQHICPDPLTCVLTFFADRRDSDR